MATIKESFYSRDPKELERNQRDLAILCEQDRKELEMLRRIHGTSWAGQPGELEKLRGIHDKWSHPSRSDIGKYVQDDAFWSGDVNEPVYVNCEEGA